MTNAEQPQPEEHLAYGRNALVAAANPLLNLIPQIRGTVAHDNPEALRLQLIEEVQQFERHAQQSGFPDEIIIGARYCLCAALDEAASLTPWGGAHAWTHHGLLMTFHKETFGGEKFFKLLARLSQSANTYIDLLELLYFCLSLGFEGEYRTMENGRSQLETLKTRLSGILNVVRGDYDKTLSPNWKDPVSQSPVYRARLPLWVFAVIAALLIGLLYLALGWRLSDRSDQTFTLINDVSLLPMPAMPATEPESPPKPAPALEPAPQPATASTTEPATAPPPTPVAKPDRLKRLLEAEIGKGLVTVRDEADRSVVIIHGDELFESGSTTIKDKYVPVISHIAKAMDQVNGSILVSGYTDNVPVRGIRFQSNWHLSQERADSVKLMIESRLTSAKRVQAEGRGEADPVAPNDTPANKALNRRVEITLLVTPSVTHDETHPQPNAQ